MAAAPPSAAQPLAQLGGLSFASFGRHVAALSASVIGALPAQVWKGAGVALLLTFAGRALLRRMSASGIRLGTERRMMDFVRGRVAAGGAQCSEDPAELVIRATDEYCWKHHWMMLIGDVKGLLLDNAVRERVAARAAAQEADEFVALEFGTYVGYSSVRIARLLPPRGTLFSVDVDATVQGHASELTTLAGVRDRVQFLTLSAEGATEHLRREGKQLDLVLIDHDKNDYLASLLRLERAGLLKPGCAVVADNVGIFKSDRYLSHVRGSGKYRTKYYEAPLEYTRPDQQQSAGAVWRPWGMAVMDGVEVSIYTP